GVEAGTNPTGHAVGGWPLSVTVPASGVSRPASSRNRTDLPTPFGPSTPTTAGLVIWNETARSTSTVSPAAPGKAFASPQTCMSPMAASLRRGDIEQRSERHGAGEQAPLLQ